MVVVIVVVICFVAGGGGESKFLTLAFRPVAFSKIVCLRPYWVSAPFFRLTRLFDLHQRKHSTRPL